MKRIVLAILLAVIMTVSLLTVGAAAVDDVSYIDANGTPAERDGVTAVTTETTGWTEGWYVVNSNVTIKTRITVTGDVSLILADDCTLNAKSGISVTSGNSLTIYGQSKGTGKLTAEAYQVGSRAGIGGNTDNDAAHGNITINGGTIEATSYGGAGIGSGSGSGTSDKPNGTITINGGSVTATANVSDGAGIGGGYNNNIAGGDIVITGGTVEAKGAKWAAGIGTGYSDKQTNGRSITISGGKVTATGGEWGAGIGGGYSCKGLSITSIMINGNADVTANGGKRGAGIGSGYGSTSVMATSIDIRDSAVVVAKGGNDDDFGGAGIGTGGASGGIGNININGGTVTATGGTATDSSMYSGAGIGSGGNSKIFDIEDLVVIPSTGTITINAGTITATGGDGADGIGDGENGAGGDFSTGTDGKAIIYANSISDTDTNDWNGIVFQGDDGQVYGDVTLSDNLSLTDGQTLTVPADSSLTVPEGKKLTVTGALTNNGLLSVAGTMDNKGTIQNAGQTVITGTITGNEIKGTPTVNNPEATYTGANDVTTYYETIGDAIDASNKNGGGTVTLLKDATLVGIHTAEDSLGREIHITYIQKTLTLDLGGKTLTCDDPTGFAVDPYVKFTIQNGIYEHTAGKDEYGTAIEGTKYGSPLNHGCTITIAANATVKAAWDGIVADGNTTVNVYGKIESGDVAVYGFGPTNTIKIEGAEIVAGGEAVRQDAYHETASKDRAPSNITITDSNIKTTAANGISILISSNEGVASGNHTLKVTSSEITGAHGIVVMGTNATISGDGTRVNALNGYALAIANNNEGDKSVGTMTINGGTFIGQIGVLTPAAGDTAITMGDNCYLVTIDTNDGSTPLNSVTITTSSYTLPAAPTRNGYTFQGWYDGTDLYAAEDNVPITGNTTITARWIKTDATYSLSLDPASLNLLDVEKDTITVTAEVPEGYKLEMTNSNDSVASAVMSEDGKTITVTAKGAGSMTISVSIVSDDGIITLSTETCNVVVGPSYAITIVYGNGTENDIVFIPQGEDYKLPTAPTKPGYIFLGWRCGNDTYGAGEPVAVTTDMTFYAVWANMPDVTPGDDPDEPVVAFPFNDVSVLDWFYDSVYYVWENELMNGTDVNQFSPNSPLTRAMVWAVLARVDGETISGDSWMTEAQAWAVESGVSDGTDPTGYVTREQLVTMLYRFAGEPAGAADISGYPDAASISDWAADAMAWAVKVGLIEGDDVGALNPTANSTRAHAATFFMRFSKTIL